MMADQNDILAGNKAENSFCPDADLRLRFLACRRRNGWSLAQISRGMHVVRSFDHVSVATLERFARGACSLGREHARPVSPFKIGRAPCRERVCQYVWISVVAV